ncbi:MAG TPA: FecR family protein [Abditibacteriaceae bacterium]|jgi:hypothetical protein
MRRPALLIFVNFAILMVVFAMLTQALFIVQRVAVTEELSGHVDVQRGGKGNFRPLSRSSFIKMNDVVRAKGDGMAEFKWSDGTRLRLTPNSLLTIKKVSYNSLKKADSSQFKLTSGKVFVRIVKSLAPNSQFEVETPTAVAAVRGTIFSVEVKDGKTEVAVYKGEVKVSSNSGKSKQEETISPGEVVQSSQPGVLKTEPSSVQAAEFESQPSIVRPELSADIKPLKDGGGAMLTGQTEAGDKVTVNGRAVRVFGNGMFRMRLDASACHNNSNFVITTTDKHGAQATLTKSLVPATPPAIPGAASSNLAAVSPAT